MGTTYSLPPQSNHFFSARLKEGAAKYERLATAMNACDTVAFEAAVAAGKETFTAEGNFEIVNVRCRKALAERKIIRLASTYTKISTEDFAVRTGLGLQNQSERLLMQLVEGSQIECQLDTCSSLLTLNEIGACVVDDAAVARLVDATSDILQVFDTVKTIDNAICQSKEFARARLSAGESTDG